MKLRDLSDAELFVQIGGDWGVRDCLAELALRLADLRAERDEALDRANGGSHEDWLRESELRVAAEAERDEAYEDSRRSLDRVNRLIGGLDESKDLLAAAEADRDRLREAMKVALAYLNMEDPSFGMALDAAYVIRAALKQAK